jgi:uncharacterized membrane protein YagU involved in acid resistance
MMGRPGFSAAGAVVWGGLAAGVLDILAVFAFWAIRQVGPEAILQSIASSVLGGAASQLGAIAAAIGLVLHFAVSFAFAAAYVVASAHLKALRTRPLIFGIAYGGCAYVIMTFMVVPLSLAEFGRAWPPPLINLAASVFIHLFLFGLPIAFAASRIANDAAARKQGESSEDNQSGAKPHVQT